MTAQVPDGMSSVDAFNAIYRRAVVTGKGVLNISAGLPACSAWNAIQIFKAYCHDGYCDYVRGKRIKVNFRNFPKLEVGGYDEQYGEGTAQKALDDYHKTTLSLARPSEYDLNCDTCEYFTHEWKERTPAFQRWDLEEMFKKCDLKEEAESRIEQHVEEYKPSSFFDQCTARYGLISPPVNYVMHPYMPCDEARDHFTSLSESEFAKDISVVKLSICRSNRHLPFAKRCIKEDGEISLNAAKKILDCYLSQKAKNTI